MQWESFECFFSIYQSPTLLWAPSWFKILFPGSWQTCSHSRLSDGFHVSQQFLFPGQKSQHFTFSISYTNSYWSAGYIHFCVPHPRCWSCSVHSKFPLVISLFTIEWIAKSLRMTGSFHSLCTFLYCSTSPSHSAPQWQTPTMAQHSVAFPSYKMVLNEPHQRQQRSQIS